MWYYYYHPPRGNMDVSNFSPIPPDPPIPPEPTPEEEEEEEEPGPEPEPETPPHPSSPIINYDIYNSNLLFSCCVELKEEQTAGKCIKHQNLEEFKALFNQNFNEMFNTYSINKGNIYIFLNYHQRRTFFYHEILITSKVQGITTSSNVDFATQIQDYFKLINGYYTATIMFSSTPSSLIYNINLISEMDSIFSLFCSYFGGDTLDNSNIFYKNQGTELNQSNGIQQFIITSLNLTLYLTCGYLGNTYSQFYENDQYLPIILTYSEIDYSSFKPHPFNYQDNTSTDFIFY